MGERIAVAAAEALERSIRFTDAQVERIWAIVSAHQAGLSIRKIANATGLSSSRIHQLLSAPEAKEIPVRLNSNKGTKCEIGFYLRPFRPWSSALFVTPKTVSFWSASFGGLIPTVSCSFSSEKSYSPPF
jgi:hypothetical protein